MSFDTIRLEKGMYNMAGRSFTQVLEELDPSIEYKGTELDGLDAYQRQLKRFDIKVSGAGSDVVEKFFKTTDSASLFPEYIARSVRAGMEEAGKVSDIVATVTKIDGLDYRTITSVPDGDDKELKRVGEGAYIPQTSIKTQEKLVNLHKRGRMLVASYEALRYQRLDLFTVTLKQIGAHIAASQFADAVTTILSGDGSTGGAQFTEAASSGTLTYADVLNLWCKLDPYNMTTILVSPATMVKLLSIDEFKTPEIGAGFKTGGRLITPLGAQIIRSSAVPDDKLIGLDKSCALEMVKASDILMESDKLIDRQLERTAITVIAGFARIFADACRGISISA